MYENVDCGWLLWCTFNFFDFHQSIYVQVWDNWDNCHIHPYSTILNLAPSSDLGFQFHVFLLVFLQCSHHTFLKRALWPPARPASASVKLLWFTKLNRWGLGLIFQLSSHGKDQHLWRRENVSAHSNFKRSKEKTRQLALALWFSLDIWTGPKLMTSMTRQRMRHVTWQAPMVKASSRFRGEICLWKLGESNSTFHLPSIFKVVPPWWAWEPPTRASLWTLYVTMWMFFMLLLLLFLLRPLRNAKKCNTIDIVFSETAYSTWSSQGHVAISHLCVSQRHKGGFSRASQFSTRISARTDTTEAPSTVELRPSHKSSYQRHRGIKNIETFLETKTTRAFLMILSRRCQSFHFRFEWLSWRCVCCSWAPGSDAPLIHVKRRLNKLNSKLTCLTQGHVVCAFAVVVFQLGFMSSCNCETSHLFCQSASSHFAKTSCQFFLALRSPIPSTLILRYI